MQKIIPHLWFDKEAKEASAFYVSIFSGFSSFSDVSDSKIEYITTTGTPSGNYDMVSFKLLGYSFMAMNAGPHFTPNPSKSFMVNFDPSHDKEARKKIDKVWEKLSEGGQVLLPLDTYPFSERYGWVQDKYGFSWQLILTKPEGEARPAILPSLTFTGNVCGKAEEASNFYISVFKGGRRGGMVRYPAGMEPDKEGTLMFTDFELAGVWFTAEDSGLEHNFSFNESVSFVVNCDTQAEIDYYWGKLSAVPEAEQCGWLKDMYGVSWQIVPSIMDELRKSGDKEKIGRATEAFRKLKKFDIEALQQAYNG